MSKSLAGPSMCLQHMRKCVHPLRASTTLDSCYGVSRLTPLPNLLSIVDDISYLNEPPSAARWEGNNGPKPTDFEAPQNLIRACPKSLKRFVFVTSAGVERQKQFPWLILNTFGA